MGKAKRQKKDRVEGFSGVRGWDGAVARAPITGGVVPTSFGKSYVKPPVWEGTYSFKRVFEGCERQLNDAPPVAITNGEDILSGTDLAALMSMKLLMMAHPIFIGAEQFGALPEFEVDDLGRFLEDVRLPFDWVYFDFSSARGPSLLPGAVGETVFGVVPTTTEDGQEVEAYTLAGALMGRFAPFDAQLARSRHNDDLGMPTAAAAGFTIIPFGATMLLGDEERGPDRGDGEPMDTHAPLGMVTFGYTEDEPSALFGSVEMPAREQAEELMVRGGQYRVPTGVFDPDSTAQGLVVCGTANELRKRLRMQGWVPGRSFPFGLQERGVNVADAPGDQSAMQNAAVCYRQAVASLRALYLLMAQNVELVDADLPRQVRRHAERKGIGISKVVRVTRTKVGARKPSNGPKRTFSHRFERRGVYHHVRRGRAAKADHLTPCYRVDKKTGELTCPDGCRKIWHPPHWVGDEGPMVPKTRIWPGQSDPPEGHAA